MAEKLSTDVILPFVHPTTQEIEAEDVLTILRTVGQRAASPVVRECLYEACAEIAFLTSSEGRFEDYLSRETPEEEMTHPEMERPAI